MQYKFVFLSIILCFHALTTEAQRKEQITVKGNSVRGANETEAEAVQRAFQDAQWKAARKAGEYIQVQEILFEYEIDEAFRSEYLSSINVVSPLVISEISSSVVKTYDRQLEAERFEVTVVYEFDPIDMEKRYRSFISNYKNQQLDILNELIQQYNQRINALDSMFQAGETETARYLIMLSEASGIYDIISQDVEVRGREISRIIERQNEFYMGLVDVYIDRLDYLLKNRYYFDIPAIKNRTFLEEFDVSTKRTYQVRYRIDWYWDNQYKSIITEVSSRIAEQIPEKYHPYVDRRMRRLDRRYGDVSITNSPIGSNNYLITLNRPYYRVVVDLKNRRGRLIDQKLLHNSMANTNIANLKTGTQTDEIVISSAVNSNLSYMSIKYEPNYLFSRRLGLRADMLYDYLKTDTINYNGIAPTDEKIKYYGASLSLFYNSNSKPTKALDAIRLRFGVTGNFLTFSDNGEYDQSYFITIAPAVAIERAKVRKNSHIGVGLSYTRKYKNQLGKVFFDVPDVGLNYSNELQVYIIYGQINLGLNLHFLNNIYSGYGIRLGFSLF